LLRMEGAVHVQQQLRLGLKNFLWWLQEIFGDAEYEKYLRRSSSESGETSPQACCQTHHRDGAVSAEKFYLDRIERQYARVSRCC
jgi:hypothetical protein